MVYWVFIFTLIVEIWVYIKAYNLEYCHGLEIVITFNSVIVLILTVFIILISINGKYEKIALESEYETLLEYKSTPYYSQNEHYVSDITDWNKTISTGKSIQRDFWIGIFIPNIYDEFECISLKDK